ncbi:hypothetical protein NPIL_450491 [Nephila pilipes]|uniref:Uncharacterized protein n=1 Tax=Nephila pilipes TaxID=299642 RepID=A0A8X6NFL6_NEPPI|nr:hypothetical protein NPIL_450491 [Nephila pilipes]
MRCVMLSPELIQSAFSSPGAQGTRHCAPDVPGSAVHRSQFWALFDQKSRGKRRQRGAGTCAGSVILALGPEMLVSFLGELKTQGNGRRGEATRPIIHVVVDELD